MLKENDFQICFKVSGKQKGFHVALDLQPMYPVEGAIVLAPLDFTQASSQQKVTSVLDGLLADVVLSDMVSISTHFILN